MIPTGKEALHGGDGELGAFVLMERHLEVAACEEVVLTFRDTEECGWVTMSQYLLPKGEALQSHRDPFGCQHSLGKVGFDFGLVLSHDT